jgi:hypothetical protein
MQEMFGGDNAEVDSTPEPSITPPKTDEYNSEVNNFIENITMISSVVRHTV